MSQSLRRRFTLPIKSCAPRRSIIPFFMPFAGCPFRCVFCAQDRQSPVTESAEERLCALQHQLEQPVPEGTTRELAFYGGTFTRAPAPLLHACLDLAQSALGAGQVSAVRCSTRPDAVHLAQLAPLRKAGLTLVELGIQSFQDAALQASGRGYTALEAAMGCLRVREAGLLPGIQLLPGMPGLTPQGFLDDVNKALALAPACLRLYPCLVFEGTVLADQWRQGRFIPWSLETTCDLLGEALKRAWKAGVPVIRTGLAPEPASEAACLDGPRHPALGSMVQGEALLRTVREELAMMQLGAPGAAFRLFLPRHCQGFAYGHRQALAHPWKQLGLDEIIWHDESCGIVQSLEGV